MCQGKDGAEQLCSCLDLNLTGGGIGGKVQMRMYGVAFVNERQNKEQKEVMKKIKTLKSS